MSNLVKVSLLLVKRSSQSISSLHVDHQVFHFTLQSLFGLFQRGTFGIHSLNGLLCILKTLGKLFPVKTYSKPVLMMIYGICVC